MAKSTRRQTLATQKGTARNSRATVNGPAAPAGSGEGDVLADKMAGTQDLAAAFPRVVAAIAKHRHFVRETDPPRV